MKKFISLFLALLLCVGTLTACIPNGAQQTSAVPVLSEDDESILQKLSKITKDTDTLREDVADLVASQIKSAEMFSTKMTDAKESGSYLNSESFVKDVEGNRETIAEFIDSSSGLRDRIEKLKSPDAEELATCITAAGDYVGMINSCLTDLDAVLVFYLDKEKAMQPFNEMTADDNGDYLEMIDAMYSSVDETLINLTGISSCPAYMQESFDIYIRKFGVYENMLESMYMGFSLTDPLRLTSAIELSDRELIEESKYSIELFDLMRMQFDKVSERLGGTDRLLGDELESAFSDIRSADTELPTVSFSYQTADPDVQIDYKMVDQIFPNLYNAMDSIINMNATVDYGSVNAIVTAEIPGFTQVYEQKITITDQVTKLLIKPALLTKDLDLSSSSQAQIVFSVVNEDTGKAIVQETQNLNLLSVYDFALTDDEFGVTSRDNVLSWLTPESDGILTLRRDAVTFMDTYTEGQANSLIGYQDYGLFDDVGLNTYLQIVAIQAAISETGVRYNMGAFSLSDDTNQRVLLPDDVLSSKSGICIETAILMATAIQSAGMHPMILFLPGHAQVAVETWSNSGEYYLVETTLLPFTGTEDENNTLITYLTPEEWAAYLEDPNGDGSGEAYVVDCDLVIPLGMQGISYNK